MPLSPLRISRIRRYYTTRGVVKVISSNSLGLRGIEVGIGIERPGFSFKFDGGRDSGFDRCAINWNCRSCYLMLFMLFSVDIRIFRKR